MIDFAMPLVAAACFVFGWALVDVVTRDPLNPWFLIGLAIAYVAGWIGRAQFKWLSH